MPFLKEVVSCRSMDFRNQRKAYALRHVQHLSWAAIAERVVNLKKKHPAWTTVRRAVSAFNTARGCRPYKYGNCGRKPWKLTAEARRFVMRQLLRERAARLVTSASLQADLAAHLGILLEASTIRKFLRKKGYRWLPRNQKRKYSDAERRKRVDFASRVVDLSDAALREKLSMSMDGVVLSMPPAGDVDRLNYCWGGMTHMWRKRRESNLPRLAGQDDFQKQVPLSRAVPMWGGLSQDGFAAVLWHLDSKKTNAEDWAKAVRAGRLTGALRRINPQKLAGPWTVLCDGETFLRAPQSMAVYRARRVKLWDVPPKSPDMNPVEMFWGWLRKKLRTLDLADLRAHRPPLTKLAYVARAKRVLATQKAQAVAKRCAGRFRKTCQAIIDARGAAVRN